MFSCTVNLVWATTWKRLYGLRLNNCPQRMYLMQPNWWAAVLHEPWSSRWVWQKHAGGGGGTGLKHGGVECIDSSLTCYNNTLWRYSHGAAVIPWKATRLHRWVNGEHRLVGTLNQGLGLLVGSIESYHNPISPPGDSGSRSTSGGAGEGPGPVVIG